MKIEIGEADVTELVQRAVQGVVGRYGSIATGIEAAVRAEVERTSKEAIELAVSRAIAAQLDGVVGRVVGRELAKFARQATTAHLAGLMGHGGVVVVNQSGRSSDDQPSSEARGGSGKIRHADVLLQNIAAGLGPLRNTGLECVRVVFHQGEVGFKFGLREALDALACDLYWDERGNWAEADRATVETTY